MYIELEAHRQPVAYRFPLLGLPRMSLRIKQTMGIAMRKRVEKTIRKAIALLTIFPLFVGDARAHGGGLDELGGHNEKKTGTYHLHRGPLSGRNFDSKSDAKDALNSLTMTPNSNTFSGNVWRGLAVSA